MNMNLNLLSTNPDPAQGLYWITPLDGGDFVENKLWILSPFEEGLGDDRLFSFSPGKIFKR